jgi:hypothetical protein
VVVEVVEMEEWRLEVLLGSDTFWSALRQIQVGSNPKNNATAQPCGREELLRK